MKANIFYKDNLYTETTLEEIEVRHQDIKVGDRFDIDDKEVLITEMNYKFDGSTVDIVTKDIK